MIIDRSFLNVNFIIRLGVGNIVGLSSVVLNVFVNCLFVMDLGVIVFNIFFTWLLKMEK